MPQPKRTRKPYSFYPKEEREALGDLLLHTLMRHLGAGGLLTEELDGDEHVITVNSTGTLAAAMLFHLLPNEKRQMVTRHRGHPRELMLKLMEQVKPSDLFAQMMAATGDELTRETMAYEAGRNGRETNDGFDA